MTFNISRQPLIPSLLTLFLLAVVVVVSTIGTPTPTSPAKATSASAPTSTPTSPAKATSTPASAASPSNGLSTWTVEGPDQRLVVEMPDRWLAQFEQAHPIWSALLTGVLILFVGMVVGRIAIRYNLYAVSTCIAIPLYGLIACTLPPGGNHLTALVASALLALSVKNFGRAFCNGYGFDGMFRASGYLGLLVVVVPAAAPLALALPLAVLLFGRTLREALVGVFGLLLPLLLLCYINWGASGTFWAPIQQLAASLGTGTLLGFFYQVSIPVLLLLGTIMLLNLFALTLFLSDLYNVGTKPRLILVFNIGILLLCAATLCGPAASPAIIALLAVPSALLLPVLFVRVQHWIALAIYVLLLGGAFGCIFLQYYI